MREFRRLTNAMTRILHIDPTDPTSQQRMETLFHVFLIGGDALQQKGPAAIRQRGRIRRLFNGLLTITADGEMLKVETKPDAATLELSQDDFSHLEKCWGAYEPRGILADRVADCLDWFDAADKIDPAATPKD